MSSIEPRSIEISIAEDTARHIVVEVDRNGRYSFECTGKDEARVIRAYMAARGWTYAGNMAMGEIIHIFMFPPQA